MPFHVKTLNAFEMTQRIAACEIPARLSGHKAFVAVYPPIPDKGVHQWRVRRFEVRAELLDHYFGEGDLVNSTLSSKENLEEVEDMLRAWGVDPMSLDAPWKCDYPL